MSAGNAGGDSLLLARLRAGEAGAFDELVRSTAPRLLATLRRMLRSEEDARDALQESYFSAFRALERFEGQAKLSTWLHRIAVNTALMRLRSKRRHPETPIDELLPRFEADGHRVPDPPCSRPSAEQALDEAQRRAAVRRAVDRLPELHRTVLVLRDLEGLGSEEAAGLLGISVDAVKMRLHRARQALRTLLAAELPLGTEGGPGLAGRRGAAARPRAA